MLVFKAQGAILKFAVAEVEVSVNLARIDNLIGNGLPMLAIIEKVALKLDIRPGEQASDKLIISPARNTLIGVVEIVVIVCKADRQAANDICRKFTAIPAPLFLGIALDRVL